MEFVSNVPCAGRLKDKNCSLAEIQARVIIRNCGVMSYWQIFKNICALFWHEQSGAVEACWAHNPEVRGSKPRSAKDIFSFSFFPLFAIDRVLLMLVAVGMTSFHRYGVSVKCPVSWKA